jgi:hypothetical protein
MTAVVKTLPNGVRLLAVPMPHVQSASVGVFLRVGSRDETPQTNGISHVLEHMAFKGTTTRSVQQINLDAERLGADVNAFTSKDTTGYFMTGLGRHADRFLAMTADIVLNSTFPQAELERELDVIRQEAIEYEEDPQESSSELLDRAIWGEHPMGMPVIGTLKNIEGFTREDLVAHVRRTTWRRRRWSPRRATSTSMPSSRRRAPVRRHAGVGPACAAAGAAGAYVGSARGKRFSQVSQVFVNLAYPVWRRRPPTRWRSNAGVSPARWRPCCSAAACPRRSRTRCASASGWRTPRNRRTEHGDAWFTFIVHAVTTPDKLEQLVTATGELLREHARGSTRCTWSGRRTSWRCRACARGAHLRHDGARRRGALHARER